MNIKINAVRFNPDQKLETFINDKVGKLSKFAPESLGAEVTLKVDIPENPNNKVAEIRLLIKGNDLFASKRADSFEQGIQECIDAIRGQIEKNKDKKKNH